ncbi:universal stress protein [Kordiimonas marina]|uniref:universal stress protein n=1 Tax=Kordiimonas marina TaxID=2872312 RepID=UPI001FF4C131|nr:universal stress protein [Kordiimonas marina]MCJ9429617.1 universal stress protein [Kordiimonas marina]
MKTLLCHITPDDGLPARLDAILSLAQKYGAHILACHITPPLVSYMPYAQAYRLSDAVSKSVADEMEEKAIKVRQTFEEHWPEAGPPYEWLERTGQPPEVLADLAINADMTVVGLSAPDEDTGEREEPMLAGDITMASGLPVLVLPDGAEAPLGKKPALIAWDRSPEAAHAVRQALPMLQSAPEVVVVEFGDDAPDDLPSAGFAAFLARHGLTVDTVRLTPSETVAADILAVAHDREAELIVMGAYGHARLQEMIFGGATRELLQQTNLPLLLCH